MGGKQSKEVLTTIKSTITNEISNYTDTINKTVNSSTNTAINNLITNNISELQATCNSSNILNMSGCKITGGTINIDQTSSVYFITYMFTKISTDVSWQNKFLTELNSSFASSVKNNNKLTIPYLIIQIM